MGHETFDCRLPAGLRPRLDRRTVLKLAAAGVGTTVLASLPRDAGSQGTSGAIRRGGTLVLGTAQPIQTLDPHKGGLRNNRNAWGLWNALTRWADDDQPKPDLAQSWSMAPDGLSWTFKLQPGVKFHNGREMTATDVKFSLDRVMAKETASPLAAPIAEVSATEVVDTSTVRLRLSAPSGMLLAGLADVMIVARENVAEVDNKAVGTGPFKLKEYVVNDRVVLERNPDYWERGADGRALPHLDGVTVRTLTDPTALFTALSTGTVDVFWQMPPQFVVQLERGKQANVLWSKLKTIYNEFFFEITKGAFKDKRAREGLLYALDKQAIADAGYFGYAEPRWNNNIIAPGTWAEKPDLPEYRRDPRKARELLQAAGVTELKFLATAPNVEWKPISEVMERNLHEIGVKLSTQLLEINSWFGFISARGTKPWTDDTGFAPNIAFRPPEPAIVLVPWGCRKHFASYWCHEEMDRLATEGRRGLDQGKRREAYFKYQELWHREIPAIINSYRGTSHGMSRRTRGVVSLFGDLDYRRAWLES